MKNLPEKFVFRMKSLLGEEFCEYEKALNLAPVKALRVNLQKISANDFLSINPFNLEKIPYEDTGFYIKNNEKIGNHPYHHAGLIYVQEPGAMTPVASIEIQKDWKVLDMCSAPGGKSSQVKNYLGESGVLVSNEIISSRAKILTGNVERLGLKNTIVTCMDTGKLAKKFPKKFDLVIVDAPCSGEGMFRRDDDVAIKEWSEENVLISAKRQKEILDNACFCVKDGGYIVYSTCTFSLEENEKQVVDFLIRHPEFELIDVKEEVKLNTENGIIYDKNLSVDLTKTRRFYPHKNRGEGQFVALFQNTVVGENAPKREKPMEKASREVYDFLDKTLLFYDKDSVKVYNKKAVYFTGDFFVADGDAFCYGVTIGEMDKNYFKPHHQFFSALGNSFKIKANFAPNDETLKRYLRGEEIEVDLPDGYGVVTVDNVAIGGIKIKDKKAKNHYPKGLRINA